MKGNNIERRLFRLELMMYFVFAKVGLDGVQELAPIITTVWRTIW